MSDTETPIWSSFWLDKQTQDELQAELIEEQKTDPGEYPVLDMGVMRLSSGRRAIANFVDILTMKNIPVLFAEGGHSFTDGKTVYISSEISKLEDFDPTVGLALHEASHIVLTDFELIKTLWGRISDLYRLGKEIGISRERVKDFTHLMVNYIEDRYIDNYIYSTAPGYRPYYLSLYNKYFYNDKVNEALKSDLMRSPTLAAYEARILNLTNPNTDLDALPDLREIAKIISLKNISRLKTTKDRIKIATEITKIVFSNIKDHVEENFPGSNGGTDNDPTKNVVFDIRVEDDDDILGGYDVGNSPPDSKQKDDKQTDLQGNGVTNKALVKALQKAVDKQKQFVDNHGNINKVPLTGRQKEYLTIIEESGIVFVPVKVEGDNSVPIKIECVVVKNMTLPLLQSKLFPLSHSAKSANKFAPVPAVQKAVSDGILLGTRLGKKLQLRRELNTTKFSRRTSGKIDRRLLADIGLGSESFFYTLKCDKYDNVNLHISVDASSSMSHGSKWNETMKLVVAICKAASMVEGLNVAVSFRATLIQVSQIHKQVYRKNVPYIVLAYDSRKDKFSKVRKLFPYITPYGETPEGIAFDAIMNKLVCRKLGETHYFLNISDGEPYFNYNDFDPSLNNQRTLTYGTENGGNHTRKQYIKILQSGVHGMSYFIKSDYNLSGENAAERCFRKMYGKDAKFIDVCNVTQIAKTVNDLFLKKE